MTIRTLLATAALLAVAMPSLAAEAVIRGQAVPDQGLELKPGTVLEVQLLDVSAAPGETRGSVSVPVRRLGPVPFVLSYDPAAIDGDLRYALAAQLVQGGLTVQRSEEGTPVLTGGAGRTAKVVLVALAEPEAASSSGAGELVGDWTLAEIGGTPAAAGVETTLSLTGGAEATGRGGCNGFHGSYTLDGDAFRFGPVASTRRACPGPQMDQENRFFAALEATRGFRVEDGALLLVGEDDAVLARLNRR